MESSRTTPRPHLLIVIVLGVFLSIDATFGAGTAVSGTVTHYAPGSLSATTAAPASTNDEDVVVADGSTRAALLAEDLTAIPRRGNDCLSTAQAVRLWGL
jgi:hypothetical protein